MTLQKEIQRKVRLRRRELKYYAVVVRITLKFFDYRDAGTLEKADRIRGRALDICSDLMQSVNRRILKQHHTD